MNMPMILAIAGIVIGIMGAIWGICLSFKRTADPLQHRVLRQCVFIMTGSAGIAMLLFFFLPMSFKFYFWLPFPFAFLLTLLLWKRNIKG